jgi:hypothetical protein
MHKLDPHTLFSIFEKGDEEIYREHGMEDQLKNPYVLMGMVIKGLENYQLMTTMYTHNFPQEFKRNKANIQKKYYTRLYQYLTRIDSDRFDSLYTIGESFETVRVEGGLTHLMYYFESIEEYEKCAVIKRYIDHLKLAKEITLGLEN